MYVCERGRQQQWLLCPTTAIAVRTGRGNVEGACLVRGMMTGACRYPRCAYKCKLALRGEGEGDVVSELFRTQELRRAKADCHDTSVLSAKRPHVIFDICLSGVDLDNKCSTHS